MRIFGCGTLASIGYFPYCPPYVLTCLEWAFPSIKKKIVYVRELLWRMVSTLTDYSEIIPLETWDASVRVNGAFWPTWEFWGSIRKMVPKDLICFFYLSSTSWHHSLSGKVICTLTFHRDDNLLFIDLKIVLAWTILPNYYLKGLWILNLVLYKIISLTTCNDFKF